MMGFSRPGRRTMSHSTSYTSRIIFVVMTSQGLPSSYFSPSLMTTIQSLTYSAWLRSCSTITTPMPFSRLRRLMRRIISIWWEISR